MAKVRARIQTDLETSQVPNSIIGTDSGNEPRYIPPQQGVLYSDGSNLSYTTVDTLVKTNITDGTNSVISYSDDTLNFVDAGVKATIAKVGSNINIQLKVTPSTDTQNALVLGADGKPYVPKAQLITGATWDDTTNTLNIEFADGSVVAVPIVDDLGSFISDFNISDGVTVVTIPNHSTVTYSGNNLIKTLVSGNTVTMGLDTSGSVSGQIIESTGPSTTPIWKTPLLKRIDEFPTSAIPQGTNSLTLNFTPNVAGQINVFRNGILQLSSTYSRSGNQIIFSQSFGASPGAVYSESASVIYYT